jgi:tetratricopeptide (TPR) repeat protein
MSNPSEIARLLTKAARSEDWDSLDGFEVEEIIHDLPLTDKQTLSRLFFEYGQNLLQNPDAPLSMERAYCAFEKSLRLDGAFEKAWLKFSEVNLKLALADSDIELLYKSNELFLHTDELYKLHEILIPVQGLWHWGICLYGIAKDSEEAIDYKSAIEKMREAHSRGLQDNDFYLDYGMALGEMGIMLGNVEFLSEAVHFFEKTLQNGSDHPLTWLRLACTYKVLYLMTADVEFFEKADQSFVAAARQQPQAEDADSKHDLWVNWAELLVFEGKISSDPDLLSAALEKLVQIDQKNASDSFILNMSGDALTHLGIFEDRFEYFKEAQTKLELAHSLYPNNVDTINHLGHCLSSMGKYLGDTKHLLQAIEKFQKGISIDKSNYQIWHGLAMTNFLLGEETTDIALYEKSLKFFSEVIKLGGDLPIYWNDWGVALMKLGELTNDQKPIAEAVEKFEAAIQSYNRKSIGPSDPDWFYNYGCALDWLGSYDPNPVYFERSITILSRLLDQYPTLHHIRYSLGLSLYHLGDVIGDVEVLEQSIDHFSTYIQSEPEDDTAISDLGLTYLTLAEILEESIKSEYSSNCFIKAEQFLSHAIALGNTRSNYYMACLHSLKGDPDAAIHFLNRTKPHDVLPPLETLLEDDWLTPLLNSQQFIAFIEDL